MAKSSLRQRQAHTDCAVQLHKDILRMARRKRGLGRACRKIERGSDSRVPHTAAVLAALQAKHPAGDSPEELQEAEAAGWQRVRDVRETAATGGHTLPTAFKVTADAVRTGIMRSNADSAPGPSGLSNNHLQCLL